MHPTCRLLRAQRDIEGEVLLTIKRYHGSLSVSRHVLDDYSDDSSDEEPSGPVDHATQAMKPVEDAPLPRSAFAVSESVR